MPSKRSSFPSPMVMRDIPEYSSPIDGGLISSRSARREDLRRNGCVEVEPPKRGRNPDFGRKARKEHADGRS